ncbi:MAG: 2-succinyl-5-enolpyruvyl-6-hydroxy-3-cyclohexene-1-carboxylic-acid synthase [Thermoleophilia bacterium]|nr:2-succinyl-5-enolpyruvyl-6-hydroxy-3-cyclohexene-1-carboxylic-acid synthase [Thermoleophilia bacterium]GIK78165.1 MAG: 2-succinyl-5-enolpyruvyl-6-hydroxy-3-cyclohexene- 1-carboxylate synthase [Actinomycetes bacterium]
MIDATNRNTALASALVEELARAGVRHAFLSPGSRSTPIALALDREPAIALEVVLDERCAAFAALGAGLASGAPAVVACTSGSAAANLHPAVVEADEAGVPMIALTSDRPAELRAVGAGQTIDQIGLFGSATRWFCEVGTHAADDAGLLHMRATGSRAVAEASGRRGPVHLNLAWREPLGPEPAADVSARDGLALGGRSGGGPLTAAPAGREAGADLVAATAEAVGRAARGMIVAGRLPGRRLVPAISALAERTGFPLLADPTSQLRFGPHDRTAVVTAYDLIVRAGRAELAPDLVLRFGDMPTSKALRLWLRESGCDQIVVDPPGRWNEPTRVAGAFVRADPEALIERLLPLLPQARSERSPWQRGWREAESAARAAIAAALDRAGGLSEPALQRALGRAYGDGERVLLGSSMPIRDAEAFLEGGPRSVTFHANRGANGIDGLVSTGAGIGLGAAAPAWIVIGDLALAHDIGGLALAARIATPIRVVVVDNGGGGIFDFLPQAERIDPDRFRRLFTTPSGLDLEPAAAAYGLPYERIADEDGIEGLAGRDRVLAHVPIGRGDNVGLHRRIAAAVASPPS